MITNTASNKNIELVAFNIVLDDLFLPDGDEHSALLGGGGPQTAFGMRLWAEAVGIFASVGEDLPQSAWSWLRAAGVDTQGLLFRAEPTLRAQQRIEPDGRRAHLWQVSPAAVKTHLNRTVGMLPQTYRAARGFHLGIHPDSPDWGLIEGLAALGGVLSLEAFRPADRLLSEVDLARLLQAAEVFSCNWHEGRSMTGLSDPRVILRRLLALGGSVVALRMGAEGSLAAEAGQGKAWRFPAYPTWVVDALGAGNAYCGGFLAGWLDGQNLREAGARGAAAASFLIEQVGLPHWEPDLPQRARERADQILERAQEMVL